VYSFFVLLTTEKNSNVNLNIIAIIISHQMKKGQLGLATRTEGMIDIQEILVREHERTRGGGGGGGKVFWKGGGGIKLG